MDSTESIHGVEITESLIGKWVKFSNNILKNYNGYIYHIDRKGTYTNSLRIFIAYTVAKSMDNRRWGVCTPNNESAYICLKQYGSTLIGLDVNVDAITFNAYWIFWNNGNEADRRHTIIHSIIE